MRGSVGSGESGKVNYTNSYTISVDSDMVTRCIVKPPREEIGCGRASRPGWRLFSFFLLFFAVSGRLGRLDNLR